MASWPASCPRCGSAVVDTLWSDHTVPIYACGSAPMGPWQCSVVATIAPPFAIANVEPVSDEDRATIVALIGAL